jgi:amidase
MNSYRTAEALLSDLKNKKISAYALIQQSIERIKALNPALNAIAVHDFEKALEQAKNADEQIQRGEWKPLLGLPITVKESFHTKDFPTTWGNPAFKDHMTEADGLSVQRLKAAGAIILGKSNVPFMLKDWQTNNPIYGLTKNPWNPDLTCGGSSGGSAVALASGMVPLELGSDLAGSIRTPAHFCGVYSHRPSSNLVPLRGSGPPGNTQTPGRQLTFPVSGPMARSAKDLRLMLDVIAGPDPLWEGRGYALDLKEPKKKSFKDYKILVINEHPLCPLSKDVDSALAHTIHFLQEQGSKITYYQDSMPDLAAITQNYITLFSSFGSVGLSDEDHIKLSQIAKTLDPNNQSIQAHLIRGRALTQRDYLRLDQLREKLRCEFIKLFETYDLILAPVMPTTAFPHDFSDIETRTLNIDGQQVPYTCQYSFVSIPTTFGLPSTIVPIQTNKEQLPIGMQIIGNFLDDYKTMAFAALLECNYNGFNPPPA